MNRFYVRRFLNCRGHHAGAYVLAKVTQTSPGGDPDQWSDVLLEISDCYRHVSFDFPMYSARDRSNSLYKARLLADVFDEFCAALEIEAELEAQRSPGRKRQSGSDDLHDLLG